MWSFALRPVWLVGHLIAAVAVVTFVLLGIWQLDRLGERTDRNDAVLAAADLAVLDIGGRLDETPAEFRTVRISGSFLPGTDILIRNRSVDGVAGFHLLTPLRLDDGSSVLVRRGFVAASQRDEVATSSPRSVVLTGRVRASESANRLTGFGWIDGDDGQPAVAGWVDVATIARESGIDLAFSPSPRFVDVIELSPGDIDQVRVLPEPELSRGPHLSYAGQWFLFAAVVLVGYPLILRRAARTGGSGSADEPSDQANDTTSMTSPAR